MKLREEVNKSDGFTNIEHLAQNVVEGLISGLHKSPFHGFSAEFAEHKSYNNGESTKHIDWKLYAKTDKLYTKRYEEETNLRCHIIVDNSSSMHYPELQKQSIDNLNKIGFTALAAASLMQILKKQRDAVGISIYSDKYDYYAPEKGSERHHQMILKKLEDVVRNSPKRQTTETYTFLHQIAEKIKRRSLIFLFTDMFQASEEEDRLIEALRHLKYNKHEMVLFHTYDSKRELNFNFENTPKRYIDVETGESINLYADNVKENYQKEIKKYFAELKMRCMQYGIKYVPVDIHENFNKILTTYLIERQKFV
ncbi:DUF58 domain-containing protein [Mesonia maritima]|uniref:Uncharacterized protein (DUF58 family) n=1 Tax=Mesonia maritima TaxID=1793873 RepID=A0ABU1K338_9FLAO|nr:DUF58 domain-containing protein [Mesonia maritima]MDR6299427.1 uncharacterized protein (DUF58 family) [Mesonia maritima]